MRTGLRIAMLVAAVVLIGALGTPVTVEASSCEFTIFGQECYYTYAAWCNETSSCWAIKSTTNQGVTTEQWVNIWPALVGSSWCIIYYYNTVETGWINSVAACNPAVVG
jgi:hypothetical protein